MRSKGQLNEVENWTKIISKKQLVKFVLVFFVDDSQKNKKSLAQQTFLYWRLI